MIDNKMYGSILGGFIGFILVITCTSPLSSDTAEVTSSGKYQISTCINSNGAYIIETISNTETGEIVSRHRVSEDLYTVVN